MLHTCPVRRSTARTHAQKLQVLQSESLRIANNATPNVSNRHIDEGTGIPLFRQTHQHTEGFGSDVANAGNLGGLTEVTRPPPTEGPDAQQSSRGNQH
jgi:hypothetical protein